MGTRAGWIVLFVLAMLICPIIASAISVIPADKQFVRSLDGKWHFRLEQDGDYPDHVNIGGKGPPVVLPKNVIPFQNVDYREDKSWQQIDVPGNWEMAGFSPATYHHPDNAIGLYRLEFDAPIEWKSRIVKLNFDGVQNGAEVFCNGEPVDEIGRAH